jgi:hypothetical protein
MKSMADAARSSARLVEKGAWAVAGATLRAKILDEDNMFTVE